MDCLDDATIAAFIDGHLEPDAAARAERHLDRCVRCSELLAELGRTYAADPPATGPYREPADAPTKGPAEADAGPADLPAVGERLGRYVVDHPIGAGGMGVVLSATDPALGRRVAIKLLRPELWQDQDPELARERLLREAQAMARLAHANVLAVHDVGTERGGVFIAMDLVEGVTLARWLALEPRSADEILDVFLDAARGLGAAHDAAVVHRDFKPDNVLVRSDGQVLVTDFGLARTDQHGPEQLDPSAAGPGGAMPSPPAPMLTRPGLIVGTPAYMAPEQLTTGRASAQTDQFSFCVALYEALCGHRPYEAGDLDELLHKMHRHQLSAPAAGRQVPEWVVPILRRGLHPVAEQRFDSMQQLIGELQGARAAGAEIHLKANAVLLMVMWVLHALWMLIVSSVIVDRGGLFRSGASGGEQDFGLGGLFLLLLAILFFSWVPLGVLWTPLNAWALRKRRPWARISTLLYACWSLPTLFGTPYALYGIWSLTRPRVRRLLAPGAPAPVSQVAIEARAIVRLRTVGWLQLVMTGVHVLLVVLLWSSIAALYGAPVESSAATTTAPSGLVWQDIAALTVFVWAPLGALWAPVNAMGLLRRKRWARLSTLLYALISVPTVVGTPFAAFALLTLLRKDVTEQLGGHRQA